MDITLELLLERRTAAEARKNQLVADLNGMIGEVRVLEALIAAAQEDEPQTEAQLP